MLWLLVQLELDIKGVQGYKHARIVRQLLFVFAVRHQVCVCVGLLVDADWELVYCFLHDLVPGFAVHYAICYHAIDSFKHLDNLARFFAVQ